MSCRLRPAQPLALQLPSAAACGWHPQGHGNGSAQATAAAAAAAANALNVQPSRSAAQGLVHAGLQPASAQRASQSIPAGHDELPGLANGASQLSRIHSPHVGRLYCPIPCVLPVTCGHRHALRGGVPVPPAATCPATLRSCRCRKAWSWGRVGGFEPDMGGVREGCGQAAAGGGRGWASAGCAARPDRWPNDHCMCLQRGHLQTPALPYSSHLDS